MRKTLNIDTKISLLEFCERFVKHNTIVYLYSEKVYKDDEGHLQRDINKLECVMDWQITMSDDEYAYYHRAHPDVSRSNYRFNNVVAVINAFEEHCFGAIDYIALIIDLDNVLCNIHGDTCEGKSFDEEIWVKGLS